MAPSVYLAGPIKGLTFPEATDWRDDATEHLTSTGYLVYSPMRDKDHLSDAYAHTAFGDQAEGVDPYARDMFDIKRSDVVLVNLVHELDVGHMSRGTSVELGAAGVLGKFVVVLGSPEQTDHPFVAGPASAIVRTLDEAYETLRELLPVGAGKVVKQQVFSFELPAMPPDLFDSLVEVEEGDEYGAELAPYATGLAPDEQQLGGPL